ncbi:MAG: cell division protein FtsZ [Candidatus Sericytochromatia bacterium]|nr:cell division protein FtsZ [Candidatus Sericytochromatia bacterium]
MSEFLEALPVDIKVCGVGGGGGNAVNSMVKAQIDGVSFVALNTDVQALKLNDAEHRIQLGRKLSRGRGVGGDPEKGAKAAEESADEIRERLQGAEMVFVTAGMGGGTGTGAAPVIASIARELGALTVGVVTRPFHFEGPPKGEAAAQGISNLLAAVDALIVIPNERLREHFGDMPLVDAFKAADDLLRQAVQTISDVVVAPGYLNIDFEDVKKIMARAGSALMGMGMATGKDRAAEAARQAIASPLLESSFQGASGLIVNIRAAQGDFKLHEMDEAMAVIRAESHPEAHTKVGLIWDETLGGAVQVTVIATGFKGRQDGTGFRSSYVAAPLHTTNGHATPTPVVPADTDGGAQLPAFLRTHSPSSTRPRS